MNDVNIIDPQEFRKIAKYVLHREPTDDESSALLKAAFEAQSQLTLDQIETDIEALRKAPTAKAERKSIRDIIAHVTRAIVRHKLADANGVVPENVLKWTETALTAAHIEMFRPTAIWRTFAGLGSEHDNTITRHALKSAQMGKTLEPAPQAEPEPIEDEGPEENMIDPTELRNEILKRVVISPAGLPQHLRTPEGQAVYIDAVIQAVDLLGHGPDEEENLWVVATAGLLLLDGHFDAKDQRFFQQAQRIVTELSGSAKEAGKIQIDGHMDDNGDVMMFAPDPSKTQRMTIFGKSWHAIKDGLKRGAPVFLQSYAATGRRMVERYDEYAGTENVLSVMANATYEDHVTNTSHGGGGGGGAPNLELPPLNDPHGYNDEIERDNVRAVSTIYVSHQLEFALKACSRVLDLFVAGLLPINASDGGARELDRLYWDQEDLMDEATRRSIQSRVLGAPGGEIGFGVQPNTEFNTLLMRVVSSVSEYERELSVLTHFDNAAHGRRFQSTSGEFVRKAVRDFAANASLRGWAGTAFAAERIASQITRVMKVLNLPAVKNAFGVTTPWQVVERVSQREFGITVNTVLHRTLAVETQRIMEIIANNHTIWSNGSGERPLFSTDREQGDLSLEETRQLMISCQHFRAVTGVGDSMLNEYSDPVETTAQPSLPDIGSIAGMGSMGGGSAPGVDMGGIAQIRDMLNNGQTPSIDQIRTLLPIG